MQQWKKHTMNRCLLAAPFSVGIGNSRRGGPQHHQSQKWETSDGLYQDNGEYDQYDAYGWWFLIAMADSIGRYFTNLQENIILPFLSCNFCMGVRETFIRAFYLHYRSDFFTGDVTNFGLHAAFFYFFDSQHSRLVTGLVSLLKTQPLPLHEQLVEGHGRSGKNFANFIKKVVLAFGTGEVIFLYFQCYRYFENIISTKFGNVAWFGFIQARCSWTRKLDSKKKKKKGKF